MKNLENKIAIVTGAGAGIGKAVAIHYAKEGAAIVVSDINEKSGKETAAHIKKLGGEAVFVQADTSKAADNEMLVQQTIKHFGRLHIACNNAGIGGAFLPTADYPVDEWDKVIAINLSGVFYGLHFQVPAMIAAGGGCIVNMASILGMVGTKNLSAYVAAKHGVVGLTKAAALDYADKNIRINCIGPGYIDTPLLTATFNETTINALAGMHPIGRLGTVDEIAELVLWLSSSKSSFVTGSYYTIDGGYTAQ